MKILINRSHGGFQLSDNATIDLFQSGGGDFHHYVSEELTIDGSNFVIRCTNTNNIILSDLIHVRDGFYKQRYTGNFLYFTNDGRYYIPNEFDERTNKHIIEIFEKKGSNYCSGDYSVLKLIEIPDDIRYEIVDNNGMEVVREISRSWQ